MARLTDRQAKSIKAGSKALSHGGVRQLRLKPSMSRDGVGSWILGYKDPITQKRKEETLGQYPLMNIRDAEVAANELLKILEAGKSPQLERARVASEQRQMLDNSFAGVVEQFFVDGERRGQWRNPRHVSENKRRLAQYISPMLGNRPIATITARDIAQCLQTPLRPVIHGSRVVKSMPECQGVFFDSPPTAKKIIVLLNQIFDFAEAREMRSSNPMKATQRLLGAVKNVVPQESRHYASMPHESIPRFVAAVLGESVASLSTGKRMLLLQILTACRTGAMRGMRWEDINLAGAVWTLPALREGAKTSVTRVFPLTKKCVEILRECHRGESSGLVFPSKKNLSKPVSDMLLTKLLRDAFEIHGEELLPSDIAGKIPTPHGFRAGFKNWSIEHGFDERLSELQLCHTGGDAVRQAYARTALVEQRRPMMAAWEAFVMSEVCENVE